MMLLPPRSTLFPTRRSSDLDENGMVTLEKNGFKVKFVLVLVHDPVVDEKFMYVMGERENTNEDGRSEEHTSELQSRGHLVCRLLLEKKQHPEHGDPKK